MGAEASPISLGLLSMSRNPRSAWIEGLGTIDGGGLHLSASRVLGIAEPANVSILQLKQLGRGFAAGVKVFALQVVGSIPPPYCTISHRCESF